MVHGEKHAGNGGLAQVQTEGQRAPKTVRVLVFPRFLKLKQEF
jgi:hypothetical protein